MDLFDALATRRTAGAFNDRVPPRALVERIIEAATWAPNHRRTEPWRFVVLAGEERVRFGEHLAAAMRADGVADKVIDSTRTKVVRSPILVVVAQQGSPDDAVRDLEDYAACCCATENLLLAAHAEGLAAKWSTGEMATMPAAFEYLGLMPADRVVGYIYLGYAADAGAPPKHAERTPAVVSWRGFEG